MKSIHKIPQQFLFIIFLFAVLNTSSQTPVPGGTVAGTWHLSGSPYQVQGSIMIPNDSVLTIEPGVKVEFNGMYKLLVLGCLKAIGTVSDTISFTALNTGNGWRAIRFNNTTNNNDSSIMKYCKLTYGVASGGAPDNCGGALYMNNYSKLRVDHSLLSLCTSNESGGAVFLNNSNPLISNSTISYNTTVSSGSGGAIYMSNSSPRIISNNIINNLAQGGGAIFCTAGSPSVTSNTISANSVNGNGSAGIQCLNSNITIQHNTIEGNYNQFYEGGGVMCAGGTSVKILNNIIRNNTAMGCGGIACSGPTNALIDGNIIYNNVSNYISTTVSSSGGGGLYLYGNNITVSNNYIFNNTSYSCGGAVYCNQGSATFINNVICNNTAALGGAFFYMAAPNPVINNNTISNNYADKGGAFYCFSNSNPVFNNTIFWGNRSNSHGDQAYLEDEASDPAFKNCDVEGGTGAFDPNGNFYTGTYTNNINSNPSYVNPSAGAGSGFNGILADWSLLSTSTCVDGGYLTGAELPNDIAGNTRVTGTTIDIGAFEQSTTMGIKNQKDLYSIKIYPNPATEFFIVEFDQLTKTGPGLSLYDVYGQKMKAVSNINDKSLKIYRDNLPAGIYFIQITDMEKIIATQKIVVADK
jgi:hypothetical protein